MPSLDRVCELGLAVLVTMFGLWGAWLRFSKAFSASFLPHSDRLLLAQQECLLGSDLSCRWYEHYTPE